MNDLIDDYGSSVIQIATDQESRVIVGIYADGGMAIDLAGLKEAGKLRRLIGLDGVDIPVIYEEPKR